MKKTRIALIGAGGRGVVGIYGEVLGVRDDMEFVAMSDPDERQFQRAIDTAKQIGKPVPAFYTDYKKCIDESKPDVVIVTSSWVAHVEVCIYAMEKGVPVACDVGGAYSIQQLWDLVRCYERTKTPIMFMENCCYGRLELMTLNLKRAGELGEIVHCEGAYGHDLRHEIVKGFESIHYRYQEYLHRNCENYPTHEIGPLAMILDINRGNRFTTLYSVATKAVGMEQYIQDKNIEAMKGLRFKQGDIITTTMQCYNGQTVTIKLDTTLPRYRTRNFLVQGTKGMVSEETDCVYLDKEIPDFESQQRKCNLNNLDRFYQQYEHKFWKKEFGDDTHGGIDMRVFHDFFDCLKTGKPMPIDVYDMATWMAISALSEQSIATGQAVAFPDFTDGKWIRRENEFAK